MTEPLTPAEHVVPAPAEGWSAKDLSDDELVDDRFIADDPTSSTVWLIHPGVPELPDGA